MPRMAPVAASWAKASEASNKEQNSLRIIIKSEACGMESHL